ncbi:MAG: hypothetical protein ACD_84C00018G0002 [uncultured bacterium]|nr:MAG: hypothetical protein ACD_84C00018G0002 [uncultured bacterium]
MPGTNLAVIVDKFIADTDLVRQFTNGDKTTIVVGSAGNYPSLAKIADDAQKAHSGFLTSGQASIDTLLVNGQAAIDSVVNNGHAVVNNLLSLVQGIIAKKFDFAATKSLHVIHNMGTFHFDEKILNINGQRVYAPIDIVNANEFVVKFTDFEEGSLCVSFYLNI